MITIKNSKATILNSNDECEGIAISFVKNSNAYFTVNIISVDNFEDQSIIVKKIESYIIQHNIQCAKNGLTNYIDLNKVLILCSKYIKNSYYKFLVPFKYWKEHKQTMFGGLYVMGDSTFTQNCDTFYPLPVHNRVE